jgi:amino acid transporter
MSEGATDLGQAAPDPSGGTSALAGPALLSGDGRSVFTRQATGLVRLMGVRDTLLYNTMITTIILGAALIFLTVPYAFPGANIPLGLLITGVLGTTMMIVYAMLGTAMPRSGGDYVFQSRLVHPALGSGLLISGYVIWLAFWEVLGGWMLATMALSPFASALGIQHHIGWLATFGRWAGTPGGITLITLIAFAVCGFVLLRGTRLYRRIQSSLWGLILLSFVITWILLLVKGRSGFTASFNSFAGHPGYYQAIISSARAAGYGHTAFSWAATFGVAPVAWTVLAWAMWSVLTAGELKDARRLRSATVTIVGALWINVALITVTAIIVFQVIGSSFLGSLAYLWFADPAKLGALPAAPYFGLLVAAVTTNPLLTVLLALGFVATAAQILIAMAWGGSRVILALSLDRVLPESLSNVSARLHAPVRAIAFFFALSVAWTFLYNLTSVSHYTLAVTLASILVYLGTMLAAIVFPYRAKAIYQASPAAAYHVFGIPLITVLGVIAFVFNAVMAGYFLVNDKLGVNNPGAEALVGGILAASVGYYYVRRAWLKRQGYEPDLAFATIPPE